MLSPASAKYRAFPALHLSDRRWPDQVIRQSPQWLSADLRDGNQALVRPMSPTAKLKFFETLVRTGFRQIEVAFPAASQADFDFVRLLIEQKRIPDDVTIQVITQARPELIRRTFEALRGAPRAIVHLYNATSPQFRKLVYRANRSQVVKLASEAAQLMQDLAQQQPETDWRFQYSPESFNATELDFALEMCEAVLDIWQPTPRRKAIINLPATVERCTPNIYADQIEWMHRKLSRRDSIVLSVHPHNDRGTAVAAAELALQAGAERVEGCLFGNGERSGNVDLVTLALNLYTQGVDPGLDFSDLDAIARVATECNGLPIHPRHPYAGELVYTAFSGSHQDAIKKGLAAQIPGDFWQVPYLPLDPQDVGRDYEALVRINSQSGKAGVAHVLQQEFGVILPRVAQIELAEQVQQLADFTGREVGSEELWRLFEQVFLLSGRILCRGREMADDSECWLMEVDGQLSHWPRRHGGRLEQALLGDASRVD